MVNTKYHPNVEARRADYTRLAESIIFMLELETNRAHGMLDVEPEGATDCEPRSFILSKALLEHIEATFTALDLVHPDTIRKFYVELRLFGDQQALDRTGNKQKESGAL